MYLGVIARVTVIQICRAELSKSSPNPSVTGGHKDLQSCARGWVSEDCGKNKIARYYDPYTPRPLGPRGRRRR